jgi:chromosome segregation ATPase
MAETVKILGVKVDIGQAEKRLGELNNAMGVLKNQKARLDKQMRTGKQLTRAQQVEYAKLTGQIQKTKVQTKQYSNSLAIANGTMKKTSGFVMGIRKALTGMAGQFLGVMAAFMLVKNVVGIFKDFEQANADLAAVLGKTRGEIKDLTDDAIKYGSVTKFTASEVSGLQKEFAKLGFTTKEIKDATKATLDLAAATGSDLARAAEVTGATVRGFGLDAKDAKRVTDVMAKSFSSSALDMEKFATSMRAVAPVAKNAGLSVEKTTAMLGTLTDRGIDASTSGTALRNVFLELSKKGLTFEEAMEKINTSTDKNKTAMELFGKRGAVVGTILAETGEDVASLENKLNRAGGAAKKMADEQLDTLDGKLTILNSAWEGFILNLESGDGALSTLLEGIVETTTGVLSFLSGTETASEALDAQTTKVADLETALNPLLSRYEELQKNSELTKDEQIELKETIEKIGEIVPTAITEFGKYGEALSISAEATKEVVKQQKNLLLAKHADAIKEQEERLVKLNHSLNFLNRQYDTSGENVEVWSKQLKMMVKASPEEIAAYQAKTRAIQTNIDGTKAYIKELKGEQTEAEKRANRQKAEAEEEKKRQAEKVKDAEDAAKKAEELAKKQTKIDEEELQKRMDMATLLQDKYKDVMSQFDQEIAQQQVLGMDLSEVFFGDEEEIINDSDFLIEKFQETLRGKEQLLSIALQNEEITQLEYETRLAEIREKFRQEDLQKDQVRNEAKIEIAKRTTSGLATMSDALLAAELVGVEEGSKKEEAILKRSGNRRKAIAISDVAINLASEISAINAVAAANPANAVTFGAAGISQASILTAIAIVKSASQVAMISAQKFAQGGVLQGKSHARGGIPTIDGQYEFEGGEAVINKRSTAKYGALLSSINQAGGGVPFERGGVAKFQGGGISAPINFGTNDVVSEVAEMSATTQQQTVKVVNVVTDTTEQQNSVINITNEAEIG